MTTLRPKAKDSIHFSIPPEMEYQFISAKVINSSTNKLQNYITLNKGALDGVKVDMGVISDEGVVGMTEHAWYHAHLTEYASGLPLP